MAGKLKGEGLKFWIFIPQSTTLSEHGSGLRGFETPDTYIIS